MSGFDRATATLEIRPRAGWESASLRELWRYRDLWWLLALRDVQVRYKQTVFGVAWAIIQPVALMIVMTLIFGKGLGLEDNFVPGVPYAIGYLAAQIVWSFFAAAVANAANSLVSNASIITKVYFPRILVPLAALSTAFVDFLIAFGIFLLLALGYGIGFHSAILLLPVILLSMVLAAFGIGLFLAALMVSYHDVRFLVPYCLQIGFFVTPVIWWEDHVGRLMGPWEIALYLNPIAGPLTTFRDVVTGQPIYWSGWALSCAVSAVLLVIGFRFFQRVESTFADIA